MACVLLVMISVVGIILLYISQLHRKMKTQNDENVKLLDGMHEGLIILSKRQRKRVLFSNNPIEKFINLAISAAVSRHDKLESEKQHTEHWLLSPKLFRPIQIASQQNSSGI